MRFFVLLIAIATALASHTGLAASASFDFTEQDPLGLLPAEGMEFGYLTVLENRVDDDSRVIHLPVYRIRSKTVDASRSPILLTMGGPGSSSLGAARFAAYYGLNTNRDFLIFEQRGTQYAEPSLECPNSNRLLTSGWGLPDSQWRAEKIESLKACRAALAERADLNAYHTQAIARDIEDLRAALGYETLSLLTLSYSTRLAQVLMHEYPDRIDQVVMAGVFPVDVDYDATAHLHQREAVLRLLGACAEDKNCAQQFPDLKSGFVEKVAQFNADPVVRTGRTILTGDALFNLVPVGSTAALAGIPARIYPLLNRPRSYFTEESPRSESSGFALGMRLSVWCAEEGQSRSKLPHERPNAVFPSEVCEVWDVTSRDISGFRPVGSDVPVLMFAGAYDPFTPPEWASSLADALTNARVILWPTMSHETLTNWDAPCPLEVARSFLEFGLVDMDIRCTGKLQHLRFEQAE